jgi:LAS superfamily LD-carboxypeptidase LdcB
LLTSGVLIKTVAEKEEEKRKLELEKHRKEEDFMMEITKLREQNLKLIQGNKDIQSKYQETLEMAKRVQKLERRSKKSLSKGVSGEVVLKRVETDGPEPERLKVAEGLKKDVSCKDSKLASLSKKPNLNEKPKASGGCENRGPTKQQNYLLPRRGNSAVDL